VTAVRKHGEQDERNMRGWHNTKTVRRTNACMFCLLLTLTQLFIRPPADSGRPYILPVFFILIYF